MSKKTVLFISLGIFVGILGWDAYLYSDDVAGNSITQTIIYFSTKTKLIPYFIGFLSGFLAAHFFDDFTETKESEKKDE